jgi:hypothetical protein
MNNDTQKCEEWMMAVSKSGMTKRFAKVADA